MLDEVNDPVVDVTDDTVTDVEMADVDLEALAAKGSTIADLWALWRSGKIGLFLELFEDFKAKRWEEVADDIGNLLAMFGLTGFKPEIKDLSIAITGGDWAHIGSEACDLLKLVFDQFITQPPMVSGDAPPPHIKDMDTVQARAWLADRRGQVRDGAKRPIVRLLCRNAPELLDALEGKMSKTDAVSMSPETLDRIIRVIDAAIPILTAVSAFVPYLIPVVIALKFISARYHTNHPQGNEGLGLEDFCG